MKFDSSATQKVHDELDKKSNTASIGSVALAYRIPRSDRNEARTSLLSVS